MPIFDTLQPMRDTAGLAYSPSSGCCGGPRGAGDLIPALMGHCGIARLLFRMVFR